MATPGKNQLKLSEPLARSAKCVPDVQEVTNCDIDQQALRELARAMGRGAAVNWLRKTETKKVK